MFRLLAVIMFLISFNSYCLTVKEQVAVKIKQDHEVTDNSYTKARELLFGRVFLSKDLTLTDVYCNKVFYAKDGVGEMKIPNPSLVNCEHTWPKSKFNKNQSYNAQLTDLHHLFPTVSRVNSIRSNHPFGEVSSGSISGCEISSYSNGIFEPPTEHKGNVARAMFYFSIRYDINIDQDQERFFREWDKIDPADIEEKRIDKVIEEIQGNSNPFVQYSGLVDKIEDF